MGGLAMWKNLSLYMVLPCVGLMSYTTYREHMKHHGGCEKHRPPFIKYEYLRIRNKRYPWGDGTKTMFHNPEINALPDGYEDEIGKEPVEEVAAASEE